VQRESRSFFALIEYVAFPPQTRRHLLRHCASPVLQCGAVCCRVLQCVVVCCSMLQCVAVRCSVLWCCTPTTYEHKVCCSVLWGRHRGGVFVGLSKERWDSWNGCTSTKSLLSSWKRGTYRWTWMNESIQILNSFYTPLLKLSGQMHSQSQSKVKGRLTNFYR